LIDTEAELKASLLASADVDAIAKIHKVQEKKKDFLADLLVSRVATKDIN
jgi:hypothetical protein